MSSIGAVDVALLGLFSGRFGDGKQVGAQSGFGGVELLEDFIASWVKGPSLGVGGGRAIDTSLPFGLQYCELQAHV